MVTFLTGIGPTFFPASRLGRVGVIEGAVLEHKIRQGRFPPSIQICPPSFSNVQPTNFTSSLGIALGDSAALGDTPSVQ